MSTSDLLDPLGFIIGAISPALGDAIESFKKWTGIYQTEKWLASNILDPVIKFIFGLSDEDIYEVDVVAVKMFQEDLLKTTQLNSVTNYMKKESWDARQYAMSFMNTGHRQFQKFYLHGQWDYLDYLPELRVTGTSIKSNVVKRIIEKLKNDTIFIEDILVAKPYTDDWCKYQLQELVNYDVGADFVKINDLYYKFGTRKYVSSTNTYDVVLDPIETVKILTYKITEIKTIPASKVDIKVYRIEKLEELSLNTKVEITTNTLVTTLYEDIQIIKYQINKVTVVPTETPEEQTGDYDEVTIIKTNVTEYYVNGSSSLLLSDKEVVSTQVDVVPSGTITPTESVETLESSVKGYYVKYHSITKHKIVYCPDSENVCTDTTDIIKNSIEVIDSPLDETIDESVTENTYEKIDFYKTTIADRTVLSDVDDVVISDTTEILSQRYVLNNSSSTPYDTEYLVSHTTISKNEVELTTIKEEKNYNAVDTGYNMYRETKVISESSEIVPTGTGRDLSIPELINEEYVSTRNTETLTVNVPNCRNRRYYSVYYSSVTTSRHYLWIYDIGSNVYRELTKPQSHYTNIEAYPIVLLRNFYFDISEYKTLMKGERIRPVTITKKRYDSTKELLNYIGVDPDEVIKSYRKNNSIDNIIESYMLFGVSPSNKGEIVSKILYEMFDYICDTMPFAAYIPETKKPKDEVLEDYLINLITKQKFLSTLQATIDNYTTAEIHKYYTDKVITKDEKYALLFPRWIKLSNQELESEFKKGYLDRDAINLIHECKENTYIDEDGNLVIPSTPYDNLIPEYEDTEDYGFSATFKEQAYNLAVMWKPNAPVIKKEKIGMIGTHKHYISGSNLVVVKQITLTETKTITMSNVCAVTIVREPGISIGRDFWLGDENLVIPLIVPAVERLSLMDKTDLLGNSTYMIFYSFQYMHLAWYETEAYAQAMQTITLGIAVVIVIIVTIFTFGTGTGPTISIMDVLYGAFTMAIMAGMTALAMHLIMNSDMDVRLKMVLGMIVTAVSIYAGGGFNAGQSWAATASQLVQICSSAVQIYAQDLAMKVDKKMNALNSEYDSFIDEYERRNKELTDHYQSMNSGLTSENMVGLLDINQRQDAQAALMTPNQFYYLAIDAYRNYDMLYTGFYDANVHKFHKHRLSLTDSEEEE